MAEYVNLETEVYDTIQAKPFTKIPTKPSWAQKELMIEEASQISLDVNVPYAWAGPNGVPPEIGLTIQSQVGPHKDANLCNVTCPPCKARCTYVCAHN